MTRQEAKINPFVLIVLILWITHPSIANALPLNVEYSIYTSEQGWQDWQSNGAKTPFFQAVRIRLAASQENSSHNCSLLYRTHVPGLGWLDWVQDGQISGKTEDYPGLNGKSRQIEAIQIKLHNCPDWEVFYSAHMVGGGWTDSVSNGRTAGTTGESRALMSLIIKLLPQGCNEDWQLATPKSQGYYHLNAIAWSDTQQQFVAVGQYTILTSPDAKQWTLRQQNFSTALYDVIWANNQWMAVGRKGAIYSSSDGVTWNRQNSSTQFDLHKVIWQNEQWFAWNNYGIILNSADGQNWLSQLTDTLTETFTEISVDTSNFLHQITTNGEQWLLYDHEYLYMGDSSLNWQRHQLHIPYTDIFNIFWDGTQWVQNGRHGIYISNNGIDWQLSQNPQQNPIEAQATNGEVGVTPAMGGSIWISLNGYTWEQRPIISGFPAYDYDNGINDIIWNGKTWVAVGNTGLVLTSSNGIQWQEISAGAPLTEFWDIAWNGEQWIGVGNKGSIVSSTDGINWQKQASPTHLSIHTIQWNGQDWIAIASGSDRDSYGYGLRALHSRDGKNWSISYQIDRRYIDFFSHLEWDGEQWILIDDNHTHFFNSDASQWQTHSHTAFDKIQNIKWNGQQWLAIGQYGSLYQSTDAINWNLIIQESKLQDSEVQGDEANPTSSQTIRRFHDIEWNGNVWIMVGQVVANGKYKHGIIMQSDDGINWQQVWFEPNRPLYSVAYNEEQWVAIGAGENRFYSISLTSPDGMEWNRHPVIYYTQLQQVQWNDYQWIALSRNHIFYTSNDGMSWQPQTATNNYESLNRLAWNGQQWVAVGDKGTIISNRCNRQLSTCISTAAHYNESESLLHLNQLQVQGNFGSTQTYEHISLSQSQDPHNPIAFDLIYLDTPLEAQLCSADIATLFSDGLLSIPSATYTAKTGTTRKYTDVLFQLDIPSNTLYLKSAQEDNGD